MKFLKYPDFLILKVFNLKLIYFFKNYLFQRFNIRNKNYNFKEVYIKGYIIVYTKFHTCLFYSFANNNEIFYILYHHSL